MKQIMLDLETMGTKPGCAIVSIGAIRFDLDTGAIDSKPFYGAVSLKSCMAAGLMPEADTVMWWLRQSEQARKKLYDDEVVWHIHDMLVSFQAFCSSDDAIWGNSAAFDCGILEAAYNKLNLKVPWHHYNERCYRTVKSLFPLNHPKKDASRSHDPIYDCQYQISVLLKIWKEQKGKNIVTY